MQDQEQNPYQPPATSSINTESVPQGKKRTIEEAIAYNYNFSVSDIISKAWEQVDGTKLHFFFGLLAIMAINIVTTIILAFLPSNVSGGLSFFAGIIINCFAAGFIVITLKHLRGQTINFRQDFFSIINIINVLIIASFLTTILTFVGVLLLIIPGIYLAIAYYLTNWILVDNPGTSAWQAMEASRKIITKQWFKVLGLGICLSIIIMISAIPLGIGLIWTIPLSMLSMGILYQTIFEA